MDSLLLIIDMQEGFRCIESESILPNILKLTKTFKGKIIFSKFINQQNSLFEKQLNWTKLQNKKDQQLFTELKDNDNTIIEHNTYTVLNNTLKQFLINNNITKVYLCGIYTDICIIKTAMDLFDNNIEVFIIKNSCNTLHKRQNHNSAINSLRHILNAKHII